MRHSTSVYRLDKDGESIIFNSEKDACEFLGVSKCSVASCFRRGTLCKGYSISRVGLSTHGETKTKLHKRWESMIARCEYKKHPHYCRYGGRGISVCMEWHDYCSFREWAMNNGYFENLTLDRIDPNGNYCPENCRFVTWEQQESNKRNNRFVNHNGEQLTLSQFSRKYNVPKSTVRWRLNNKRDILSGAKMDEEQEEPTNEK